MERGDRLDRRDFLHVLGLAAALPAACATDAAGTAGAPKSAPQEAGPESARAFDELLDTLAAVRDGYLTAERGIALPDDVADGHRLILHLLEQALLLQLESHPTHPLFQRQVSPVRKANGDNPDAIYHAAPIAPGQTYRIRSNQAGAVYTSITIEAGGGAEGYAGRIAGVINDTQYDVAADGSFEVIVGGEPRDRNWIALPPDAARISTRHYFEEERSVAADPTRFVPMAIEVIAPLPPPPSPTDASIAAAIRRVATYVRVRTLDQPRPDPMPSWVSNVPNRFNPALPPGTLAYAAADAAYTMAPYAIGPGEALVLTGRFPPCRFANVVLWNRFLQSYDYVNRRISLNRAQTALEPDGSFRMVVAHRDPGVRNWLDTGGRTSGLIYWRFMLPEGAVETPQARVVPFAEVRRG